LYQKSCGVIALYEVRDAAGGAPAAASSQRGAQSNPAIFGGDRSPITNCHPHHRCGTLGIGT
ncbi:MAG TPA: hypothetical protein VKA68_15140, partial [bacterium]|nr:hypothetical protein [bacterium]